MAQTSRSNPAIGDAVPTQYSNGNGGNGRSNGNGNGSREAAAGVADDQPF